MTIGLLKGVNTGGHLGWVTVRCRICNRKLEVTREPVYVCPKCRDSQDAYFCEAHARKVKHRCPYCGTELEPLA